MLLGAAGTSAPRAEIAPGPEAFALRGFGSLIATKTSDERVGWRVQNQPIEQARHQAGEWSLGPESVLGVQADLYPQSQLAATLQVLAMNRDHGHGEAAVELAFLRYRFAPEWQLRLGRIWTPSFLNSETRYVGYANTTIRNTNYTLYQITNLDGGDLRWQRRLASGNLTLSAYLGKNRYSLPNSASGAEDFYQLPFIGGGFVAWEDRNWLLRSSYTKIELQRRGAANASLLAVTVPALRAAAASGKCAICADEADKWARTWTGVDYRVATVAARYSAGAWVISGEYINRSTDGTFPDVDAFDLEINYRWRDWTPYFDYLGAWSSSNNKPVFTQPQFAALNRSYAAGHIDRTILTAGLKYDLSENFSVRAEVARIRFADPLAGVGFAPVQVGATLPENYTVTSIAVDVLF
ncbi:hypothetical protein GCM10025771_22770 [Niveibacterium umoris]|uniref:Porin n=1 Tax=Niveibacterium umoris TaxID=1193620 RepID=A0A840BJG8_9RHOO|nr:hypothetical protein [Niveibacterium umoris]MBB4012534.1 hypothetical protein [Niveibacterium umoris]